MSTFRLVTIFVITLFLTNSIPAHAQGTVRVIGTAIYASNDGADFDLENDAEKDKLLQLFSYTSYRQLERFSRSLALGQAETVMLPGSYELSLTLQEQQDGDAVIDARVTKGGSVHLQTTLRAKQEGKAFLGGAPYEDGDLIISLDVGY